MAEFDLSDPERLVEIIQYLEKELKQRDLGEDQLAVAKLLTSSWREINFSYEGLTSREKACITRDQFKRVNAWRQVIIRPASHECGHLRGAEVNDCPCCGR